MAEAVTPSIAEPAVLLDELAKTGTLPNDGISIARTAILLSALTRPGLSLGRYFHHLDELADKIAAHGEADALEERRAALKSVIADECGYAAVTTPADIENADMIRVIDSRQGDPAALCILYLHVARARGWNVVGLSMPGRLCVIRLDRGGERLMFDPASPETALDAPGLRRLVKEALGRQAELSASYFEPLSNQALLIRLQNIVKTRQIEDEDYEAAALSVDAMRRLDPEEYRLLFDAGVLYARTGRAAEAISALEGYIKAAPDARDRHEAAILLQQLR